MFYELKIIIEKRSTDVKKIKTGVAERGIAQEHIHKYEFVFEGKRIILSIAELGVTIDTKGDYNLIIF